MTGTLATGLRRRATALDGLCLARRRAPVRPCCGTARLLLPCRPRSPLTTPARVLGEAIGLALAGRRRLALASCTGWVCVAERSCVVGAGCADLGRDRFRGNSLLPSGALEPRSPWGCTGCPVSHARVCTWCWTVVEWSRERGDLGGIEGGGGGEGASSESTRHPVSPSLVLADVHSLPLVESAKVGRFGGRPEAPAGVASRRSIKLLSCWSPCAGRERRTLLRRRVGRFPSERGLQAVRVVAMNAAASSAATGCNSIPSVLDAMRPPAGRVVRTTVRVDASLDRCGRDWRPGGCPLRRVTVVAICRRWAALRLAACADRFGARTSNPSTELACSNADAA